MTLVTKIKEEACGKRYGGFYVVDVPRTVDVSFRKKVNGMHTVNAKSVIAYILSKIQHDQEVSISTRRNRQMARPAHQGAKNPYSQVTFHKHYTSDKIRHTILTVNHYTKSEKDAIRAFVKPILTGDQAQELVWAVDPTSKKKGHEMGWGYVLLDSIKRCGVLTLKGIEVALFFKRQITEHIPGAGEPLPEGIITEPADAWMRLDLLGNSAREQNLFLATKHSMMEESIKAKDQQIAAKEIVNVHLEKQVFDKDNRIERQAKQIENLKKRLEPYENPKKQPTPKKGAKVVRAKGQTKRGPNYAKAGLKAPKKKGKK